ncbi:hypothetical protein [Algoriphagus namhaensis]
MKRYIILLITLTCISLKTKAQLVTLPGTQPIEITSISLKNPGNSKEIFFGESAEQLIQAFGTPDSSEPFLFEMEEKVGSLYKFGPNRTLFMENKLQLFTIINGNMQVGRGNIYVKVGDSIGVLNTFYPNYQVTNGKVRARLKKGPIELDGALIIFTTGSTITKIMLHFD